MPSADLSNRTPSLQIQWDAAKLRITGQDVAKHLLDTDPRIVVANSNTGGVSIVPYQMSAGDEKVVADRLYATLSKPPKMEAAPPPPEGAPAGIAGQWDVHLEFVRGSVDHKLILEQEAGRLMGTHEGEFASGDLTGAVAGNTVRFTSGYNTEGSRISYQFTGKVEGAKMSGTVSLGEYGEARWTAERHQYRTGGRRG